MLQGSINHLALTVSDLEAAMKFFAPLLEFLGYSVDRGDSPSLRVNISRFTGGGINIWQATEPFKMDTFEVYAPGLHHVAFNVDSKQMVDDLASLIPTWGGRVTDRPEDYPYTDTGSYYAVYFVGPDNIKLECVFMSELERLHAEMGTLNATLWPHATG